MPAVARLQGRLNCYFDVADSSFMRRKGDGTIDAGDGLDVVHDGKPTTGSTPKRQSDANTSNDAY